MHKLSWFKGDIPIKNNLRGRVDLFFALHMTDGFELCLPPPFHIPGHAPEVGGAPASEAVNSGLDYNSGQIKDKLVGCSLLPCPHVQFKCVKSPLSCCFVI